MNNYQGNRSSIQQRQPAYNANQYLHPSQIQQQQQFQPQIQNSVQIQEMKYAVYKDLENILVILAQTQAILEYFKNDESHPMVAIAYNRFITQLNLSNTIHLDQYHIASSDRASLKELASCKQNAKQLFRNLSQQYQGNSTLQKLCKFYESKNLADSNTSSENLPLKQTQSNYQNSINQDVLQKVIQSIGGVDQIYSKIRSGQLVETPDQYQLAQKMRNKQMEAEYKLQQNFRNSQRLSYSTINNTGNAIAQPVQQQSYQIQSIKVNQGTNFQDFMRNSLIQSGQLDQHGQQVYLQNNQLRRFH